MTGDKLLQFEEAVDRISNTVDEDTVVFQLSSMTLMDRIIDQPIITTDAVTRKNVVQLLCVDYSAITFGFALTASSAIAVSLNSFIVFSSKDVECDPSMTTK